MAAQKRRRQTERAARAASQDINARLSVLPARRRRISKIRTRGTGYKTIQFDGIKIEGNEKELEVHKASPVSRKAAAGIFTHLARLEKVPFYKKERTKLANARGELLKILPSSYLGRSIEDPATGLNISNRVSWSDQQRGIGLTMRLLDRRGSGRP